MHSTNLRKVGGSVMLAVPPALLDALDLSVGTKVAIGVEGGRLVVHKNERPKYSLDELIKQCNDTLPADDEDLEWLDARPVGNELL
ncbi:MAG: antitoxin [Pseudomonadales bacterium]|nr:antitoxin [Pseudomonadales bacterium]